MNPIRTNKPVFFGDDGEVLKSGQIYIGQPNQWPLSFPKTVTLQDSAGSQFTAAQPLTTNNQGRIEYNGKSVIVLVGGDYSILVRDRNGVTVGEGYTPFVENTESSGGTTEGVTQVGLLLSDIKQFDVTPGETVRNVGKAVALDGNGATWLVVSNTGNTADDVDLIDFNNGTQGRVIDNVFYQDRRYANLSGGSTADFDVMPRLAGEPIVNSGVSGNSLWVRFANGVQMCWLITPSESTATNPVGAIYSTSGVDWTFPVEFSGRPQVSASFDRVTGTIGHWGCVRGEPTSTSVSVGGLSAIDGATGIITAFAVGLWS